MFWIVLIGLLLFSGLSYALGRRKAVAQSGAAAVAPALRPHSRPGYHGAYLAIWAAVPAALVLCLIGLFGERVEHAVLASNPPPAVQALDSERQALFYQDAIDRAAGSPGSETAYEGPLKTAMESTIGHAKALERTVDWGGGAIAVFLALAGFALAFPRLAPPFRARNRVEGWIGALLLVSSTMAVLTTLGIVLSLLFESLRFFQTVSPMEFLTGLNWSPQMAMRDDQVASSGAFGAVPLFMGTFLIMVISMLVAGPIGLFSAVHLSEYAGPKSRATIKPLLEILAGVPTVVYGFFAALTVGPALRWTFNSLGALLIGGPFDELGQYLAGVQNQMALVAGLVMGVMLIPFVSSLSDDIINAVPQALRDGSYAMGATRSETIKKVVLPAALPGIMAAMLLAVSRAIGETMIVAMAAGAQAKATFNPLEAVTTVTYQIVTLLTGDQEFDSPKTLAAFALGLTLFVITLILNIIALKVVQAYREQYD